MVTFPAAGHHRPLTGSRLYCLVTETHVCEQLAQGCYLKVERPGVEPATFCVASQNLTSTPPGHTIEHTLQQQNKCTVCCDLGWQIVQFAVYLALLLQSTSTVHYKFVTAILTAACFLCHVLSFVAISV